MTTRDAKPPPALGAGTALAGSGLLVLAVLLGASSYAVPTGARHLPFPPRLSVAAPRSQASGQAAAALPSGPPRFEEALDVSTFQKGNIHTHTNLSDGDHPPEQVYAWYRDRGYSFLAITDHNNLTEPSRWRALERAKRFVMITGEEVTMRGAGKQVHVNALCTRHTIGGKSFDTQREALAWAVREVNAQGGVALVNHPNWDWALAADDLPAARGAGLLEIASGHPYVHTEGDADHLAHEAIWDTTIARGLGLAGVAVDDAHIYGPRAPGNAARPGRAWIQVFAAEPTRAAICAGLSRGRLYASTGVTLKRIAVKDDTYAVYPADASALVEFIGQGGQILQSGKAGSDGAARYQLHGGEGYVRARITQPDARHAVPMGDIPQPPPRAWTQPARVAGGS